MNFNDVKKRIVDVTDKVGKKTNNLIEEGKLLYKIREAEREIDTLYRDLGRAVYEADEDMGVSFEEYTSEKAACIDRQKEHLASLRSALAAVKGSIICPTCGEMNAKTNNYCSKCGNHF